MKFKVKTLQNFEKHSNRLIKKYPSLISEIAELISNLEIDPFLGIPIGKNCYKIRLSIASKGKGKSGGARVITNVVVRKDIVFLLSIYDKSEQEDISDSDIQHLLNKIPD